MALKVVDQGKIAFVDLLRLYWNTATLELRLFKNDRVPADGDTLADYTEADFDGYLPKLANAWSLPTIVAGRAMSAMAPQVWVCTGATTPNNVYGILAIEVGLNELRWAERFASAPIVMDQAGDIISYTPAFTGKSES